MIDLDDASPSWSSFPALNLQRSYPNTVLLPDRSMVTVGGDDKVEQWPNPAPEKAVELYDPVTGTWQTGPSQVEKRAYHSTAVLLPDGRVLSTGDDLNPTSDGTHQTSSPNDTGEIYSPPYLFQGPRPVISSAPDAVDWNVPFGVGTASDIDDAVLIAPAATTHANDMNQRLVPLQVVSQQTGGYTLESPPSGNVAPPGWYMLFLLDDGVPSVAKWVLLEATAPDVPAVPPDSPAPGPDPQPDPDGDPPTDRTPDADPDLTGPELRLRFAENRWLGWLRRKGVLRVKVTVDEPATVDLKLLRRGRRVAHKEGEIDAETRRFELRPRRRTLRWLRRADHPRLRFSVVAFDAAENDTVWTRVLKAPLGD